MMNFELVPDLKVGNIVEVSGTSIRIELSGEVTELTRSYQGIIYPIGQIGSIVKIHFGRRLVFGFVTLLRMRSEDLIESGLPIPPEADQRIMEVELFAEGVWHTATNSLKFTRGVSTYPLPRQNVYLLTRDEAVDLYQSAEGHIQEEQIDPLVPFATYVGADSASCRANIDKMFSMHSAVLGSTGSGKSGAVAALLHSVLEHKPSNQESLRPRIIIIDPHGEYGHAFKNNATLYRAYDPIEGESNQGKPIQLPYWLMSADEFRTLVIGKTEFEATSQNNVIYKALTHARLVAAGLAESAPTTYEQDAPTDADTLDESRPKEGITKEQIIKFDADKPYPFCLNELINHIIYMQGARFSNGKVQRVTESDFSKYFKSILDKLGVLRRDPRINFLMTNWDQGTSPTLATILSQFINLSEQQNENQKNIHILDISGLPNEVAGPLTGMLGRLLFQYKLYQTSDERKKDPILLVCEEAHRYVPDKGEAQYATAQTAIRRIAREGRKYGLGLMLVSQRPADVESTVISQCGTWLVLRLTNQADQQHVARFLPDGLSGMTKALPSLGQQEAIFVGEGASLPARIRIRDLTEDKLPRSQSAKFAEGWTGTGLSFEEIEVIAKRMASQPTAIEP
ncbi:ATP-binding protein [Oligella ureolytica]|uniref:ATP-binding protein n=2 Tax=Oligella ureolytica TaxID=90244 RepID=A0A7T3BQR9_9BURK|nr:ATP-binding protein [Oligella ureolytica]QPT40112.1 ATP-binding protein [Oligella ureolytica]